MISEMAQGREGGRALVGARVYMTEEMNDRAGFEVRKWIGERFHQKKEISSLIYTLAPTNARPPSRP